ncbi:DUF1493 family protein [Citrobacter rodentium]|jgi:Protein of unknown function (DUF1493).|uniref:DUF1493 family protein n=2 Tax=Citrobacter rodentium TaxID=67825 RepID=D2TTL2_CITRI|nr:DUF1493 family protein [Citrobacter rodentium]KIQ50425.1 cytoplasmic protein [Citrobacter rodentium]QBY30142.1 DUF1493 family protein [Citrobacter rodentium]UHO32479.1 DUF1493 family protein [Citrobacter rodentium NBRC 105723 = DSM 16636]CBG90512.1 conserved hypothetical protein [Citrobacter rodentium ICC168]HAT8015608.1 cytoplasmic protein [Citrobacter rodentium NBRC 105723 = DSM 16636]
MVTDEEILEFFRDELPVMGTLTGKMIPLQMDDALQYYTSFDDLSFTMDKYTEKFNIDLNNINFDVYYPWEIEWFFRKWFTKEPVKQTAKPLTVRMFAESAKAGKWLYD